MKKADYRSQREVLEQAIRGLEEQLDKLTDNYIRTNRHFADGERIRIVTMAHTAMRSSPEHGKKPERVKIPQTERYAYVVGYQVTPDDKVEPLLKQVRRDGSMGFKPDWLREHDRMEQLTESEIPG